MRTARYFDLRPLLAVLTVGLALASSGCESKTVPVSVDNPTDGPVQVQLDDRALTLAAHSAADLKLLPGRHTLSAPATGRVTFMLYKSRRGVLLNPTLATYVLFNQVYAVSDQAADHFQPWRTTIELDGVEFTGPLSRKEGLFIDRDWQWGVHEALPASITGGPGSDGNIHGKLYTVEDFVAFAEAQSGDAGRFVRQRRPEARRPFVGVPAAVPPPIGPKAWDDATAPLRAVAERRLRAATAAEQEATAKAYFEATMALNPIRAAMMSKQSREENERQNADFLALSDVFSHAVHILAD